jgi:hypothetical protein
MASRFRGRAVGVFAAAAAVALALTLWVILPEPRTLTPEPSSPIALLSNAENATWGDSTVPTALGSELSRGTLSLRSGSAQVMFRSGAVVDIIGPCTLHMIGPNQAQLSRGRLAAYVPEQARGFTVNAANVTAVDLGTRFYMLAHSQALTTVGVQVGRVQIIAGDERRVLTGGEVVAVRGEPDSVRTLSVAMGLAHSARLVWHFDQYAAAGLDVADAPQLVRDDLLGFAPAPPGGTLADGHGLQFSPTVVERSEDANDTVACAGLLNPGAAQGGAQTMLTRFYWDGYATDRPDARMGWIVNNGMTGPSGAGAGGGGGRGWLFGIRQDKLAVHMTTDAGSFDSDRLTLEPGKWYDAAIVFDDRGDNDPTNDTVTLYLRPAGERRLLSQTAPRPVPVEAGPSMVIGGESLGVGASNHRKAFRGAIDYVAFWDHALTESQIKTLIEEAE